MNRKKLILYLLSLLVLISCKKVDVEVDITKETGTTMECGPIKITCYKKVSVHKKIHFEDLSEAEVNALKSIAKAGLAVANLPANAVINVAKILVDGKPIDTEIKPPEDVDPKILEKMKELIDNKEELKFLGEFDPIIMPARTSDLPVPSVGANISLEFQFEITPSSNEVNLPSTLEIVDAFVFLNQGESEYRIGTFDSNTGEFLEGNGDLTVVKDICECPKLISLTSFTTTPINNRIFIEWETASETNNLGMNLWCAQMQGNQFQEITQLNSELIPSKAILPNYGASYSSIDYPYVNTNLKPGVQHCTLEDIDASGQCTLHCDQIDTTVVGKDQSVTDVNLNELNAKAIVLCHQYKDNLAETGQGGICLDQLLMSH